MPATSGRYWILTIAENEYTQPEQLPANIAFIRGQREIGVGGFKHWQLVVGYKQTVRLSAVRKSFGPAHAELTRSDAALDYVWKDETAVPGSRFELGKPGFKRNDKRDWDGIWESAVSGSILDIDAATRVQHYRTLKQIRVDHLVPAGVDRTIFVYWGATGTGKSHRAWAEAGTSAFPKDPRTKFWDGYQSHRNVVMDEFRGGIDIAHILRWFDKYPVIVEVKGASVSLCAESIWITSNIDPRNWYPDLDPETLKALLRRLKITHMIGNPFKANLPANPRFGEEEEDELLQLLLEE
jgi:hypothetical protein